MCIKIQVKFCILQNESILNLIYVTEIQKFLTVYF